MRDKKIEIIILVIIILSLVGIGIAFAAFSQTLTINGTGTVESSSWSVVFEGADGSNTIGAPTLVGTATEVTRPTIKNNSTEISTYEVTLKSPGDSVTYNFKIHNKGDYAANLSSLTISGVNRPASPVSGVSLTTKAPTGSNSSAISNTYYSFFYTGDNSLVGQNPARDCLEPGESVNVSLKLWYFLDSWMGSSYLPKTDLVLDNLGISATYTQSNNGSCAVDYGVVENAQFENYDYAYYTFEGKSFIGTGVGNIIIYENCIGKAKYASAGASRCSDGSVPTGNGDWNKRCPEGTTPVFADSPAADMAEAYCTGCRLMTKAEAESWGASPNAGNSKFTVFYNGTKNNNWWLADSRQPPYAWVIDYAGWMAGSLYGVQSTLCVRPVTDVPSTATMTGSGTKTDPYVITP